MFCYETRRNAFDTFDGVGFDPTKYDATKLYLSHFENLLTLTFFHDHGTIAEKRQAFLELEICRRKMNYWRRQDNFDQNQATERMNVMKKRYTK